ncbi:MAG TPA: tetratricopeptide repeat protein [Clostridia bacterium]|nr:tetratricopeptide repeat protein [Clostridia bacterium]
MAKRTIPKRKKDQLRKIIFIVITVFISIGLVGTSIAWVLGGLDAEMFKGQKGDDPQDIELDIAERIGILESQVENNPTDTSSMLELAVAYASNQQLDEAAETYEVVLGIEPQNYGARLNAGIVYYYTSNFEKANEHFSTIIEQNPDYPDAYWWDAYTLALGFEDYEGGVDRLENFIKKVGEGSDAAKARQTIEEWQGEIAGGG